VCGAMYSTEVCLADSIHSNILHPGNNCTHLILSIGKSLLNKGLFYLNALMLVRC
jgi:hypothetical protein